MRYAKLRIKLVFKYYLRFASLTLALFLLFGAFLRVDDSKPPPTFTSLTPKSI